MEVIQIIYKSNKIYIKIVYQHTFKQLDLKKKQLLSLIL